MIKKKKEPVTGFTTIVQTGTENFAIFAKTMAKLEKAWRLVTHGLHPFDPSKCNRVGIMSMGLVEEGTK